MKIKEYEKLQERLAKLAGGVAVVRVGAATETEMQEAKLRMEDALAATRAAVEEGIIAGGGSAYIHASKEVAKMAASLEGDEKTGANIILKALEAPLRRIAENAGLEGSVIIDKVRSEEPGFGFNALTEEYVNMVDNGILDPAKVTRSALQNDGFVNKVADYISKKVADKLNGMFKTDRENYEKYWDDISPFIKFGCLKDEKFGEKMKDSMLYKNLEHKYLTLEDIIKEAKGEAEVEEAAKEEAAKNEESKAGNTEAEAKSEEAESTDADAEKEPEKTRIFYVTDEVQQSQYINMFKAQGQDAIILTHNIDSAFITYLEQKHQEVQFLRIDADVHDSLKDEVAEDEKEAFQKTAESLVEIFRKELGNDKLEVKVEKLKDDKVASMAVLSEENRRMQEMMKMYGMSGMDPSMFGSQATLVLNANHPLVQFLVEHKRSKNVPVICKQLYDLAMLAHKPLSPEEMTAFVQRSNEIMMLLTK